MGSPSSSQVHAGCRALHWAGGIQILERKNRLCLALSLIQFEAGRCTCLTSKKASLNTGNGAGILFRYFKSHCSSMILENNGQDLETKCHETRHWKPQLSQLQLTIFSKAQILIKAQGAITKTHIGPVACRRMS